MKAWAHRDAKGEVQAIVVAGDGEQGELVIDLPGGTISPVDCTGLDDPRDEAQLAGLMAATRAAD